MLNGLVKENYEQLINPNSEKRGIEDIVKYLIQSENYGTLLKIFQERIFEVNEDNYQLIINTFLKEIQNKSKGYDTRYNNEQIKVFFYELLKIIQNNLNEQKNIIK